MPQSRRERMEKRGSVTPATRGAPVRPGGDVGAKGQGPCAMRGRTFARTELSLRLAVGQTTEMTPAPRTFLCVSLAAHLCVGALVYHGAHGAGTAVLPQAGVADAHPSPEAFFAGDTFEVPATVTEAPST